MLSTTSKLNPQLSFIDTEDYIREIGLSSALWHGSFNGRESTLQQLAPYIGKMKSGMARALISLFSKENETVLDPFAGSGVVPLEAALLNRKVIANDLSPYAYTLTRGKLEAPAVKNIALNQAAQLDLVIKKTAAEISLAEVPDWVREFFHPDTLREIIVAFRYLREHENYFLLACLLGILHHQRPGFLSFPSSHLVPYLRKTNYPPERFPHMYEYKNLTTRLIAKIERAYKRPGFDRRWLNRAYNVFQTNALGLPIAAASVDAIISSPPYFGALDYARDNRLRLYFLGCEDWKKLDENLTANAKVYLPQMSVCLQEMFRILKTGAYCVLVLGDVDKNGKTKRTAEILSDLAQRTTNGGFQEAMIYDDIIPDERRTRRETQTTRFERILVLTKSSVQHG